MSEYARILQLQGYLDVGAVLVFAIHFYLTKVLEKHIIK